MEPGDALNPFPKRPPVFPKPWPGCFPNIPYERKMLFISGIWFYKPRKVKN